MFTPQLLLGIVFATIGIFVVLMGVDQVRKGGAGDNKKLIASGIVLAVLGIILSVI